MEERTEERATELVAGILKENLVLRRGSCYFFSCTLCPRLLRGEGQLSGQMREYVYTYFEMVTHSSGLLVAVITAAAAAKQLWTQRCKTAFGGRGRGWGRVVWQHGMGEPAFSDMGRRHEGEGWIRPLCLIGSCDRLFVRLILVENNRENTSGPWGAKAKGRQDVLVITSLSSQTSLYLDYAVALLETRHSLGAF